MKQLKYILLGAVAVLLGLSGCNDDYIQKNPETSITAENFFNTTSDLETYTNSLYDQLQYRREDLFTDNAVNSSHEIDLLIRGQLSADNVGGWSKGTWGNLRSINFFLVNAKKATGDQTTINNYLGIAKYFRACFYFDMIKRYGSAPWYSAPLKTTDTELMAKTQDPRTLVVDSIMQDMEYAVKNITAGTSRTRITKYTALAMLARIALFEGTFRKYHPEISLQSTSNTYLEKAVQASKELIESNQFAITGSGAKGYAALCAGELRSNKEAILFVDFDRSLGKLNANSAEVVDHSWGLTKSLADSYLKTDGTPATSDAGYATADYVAMFKDRDPRMGVTIMSPGYILRGEATPHIPELPLGGFPQIKYYTNDPAFNGGGWTDQSTDFPILRYGETLLINAEAKAELGTLMQSDLDATINKLRDRVEMPHMTMSVTIDPVLVKQYPAVSGNLQNVILEIRRERRVELACEGLRYDDLLRWAAGNLMNDPFEGPYFPGLGTFDMTGDGIPDLALLAAPSSDDDKLPASIQAKYYLKEANGTAAVYYLSEGTKGTIRFTKDIEQPRKFVSPKCYYFPIPWDQIRDNPNLKQPLGW